MKKKKYVCLQIDEAISILEKRPSSDPKFLAELKTHSKKSWLVECIKTDGTRGDLVVIPNTKHNRLLLGVA
jgi:hypothetical protein